MHHMNSVIFSSFLTFSSFLHDLLFFQGAPRPFSFKLHPRARAATLMNRRAGAVQRGAVNIARIARAFQCAPLGVRVRKLRAWAGVARAAFVSAPSLLFPFLTFVCVLRRSSAFPSPPSFRCSLLFLDGPCTSISHFRDACESYQLPDREECFNSGVVWAQH